MELQNKTLDKVSDTLHFGILLTIIGGFLETYSYIGRGHVFANGQTANIANFGMHLAAGNWPVAVKYLIPVLGFGAGVYLAEWIKTLLERHPQLHWKQGVLLLEGALMLVTASLPSGAGDSAANTVIAIICGLQLDTVRKINGYAYATTMCTGNLRSATEAFYRCFALRHPGEGAKAAHYYGIILIFILSAILGGLFTQWLGQITILFCLIPLAICYTLLRQEKKETHPER